MKVILITLFLNYELFVCKIVHKKILNHTFLTRNLHKSLKEIDTLLRGVQKEIRKERKILKSQIDYENAPIPEDSNFLSYDVTYMFWGETGVEGVTHEDVTSTFLPTLSTPPRTTEEEYVEEEIIETELTPPTTVPPYTFNTNYPGYPYEPPPFNPVLYPDTTEPTTRNETFDIPITPPNFGNMTKDEAEEAPPYTISSDYPGYPVQTRNDSFDLVVTPPTFGKLTRSLIDDFNKYFGFISQSNKPSGLYTIIPTTLRYPPLTTTPSTWRTTKQLSKYLVRNVQKHNFESGVPVSGKNVDNFVNWFSQATATTPVHTWTTKSLWAGLTAMPQSLRPLSKSQLWAQQQQMKNSATPVHREGPLTPPVSPLPPTDYQLSAAAAEMGRVTPQTRGFEVFGTLDRNPLTSTSVSLGPQDHTGIVFGGIGTKTTTQVPSARHVYYKMMEEQNEGYLVIFLQQILRITSLKDEKLVKNVLEEVELHVGTWFEHEWFGDPLTNVISDISRFVSEGEIDIVRSYSSMMYHMLQVRKTAVSVDVNSIIDYADLLYNEDEGGELFDAVTEYETYPKGSKNAKEVCVCILDSFIRPYRRLSRSERRQTLVDSINYALKIRFPLRTKILGELLNIEPQTTTKKTKSHYIKELHKRNKYKRKRKNKKIKEVDDIIKHFSSRLDNIESFKRTSKYVGDITPVINNYVLEANKRNGYKIKYNNEDKKTTRNYKNLIFASSYGNQKESAIDLDRNTNKDADFNDFDDSKDETAGSDTYFISNSKEIKKVLKKTEEKSKFELKEPPVEDDDDISTNEIEAIKEKLHNMIVKAQADVDYDKMEALKSYAYILNEENDQRTPSRNSGI
ncbi:unnamed protein product [Spodoptera littoralis]|uniref:Uncharacterized protein n=1 Tax=Spodoptera littoralis TaxID=7109 RepID=A0A9P0N5V3_SPOLI|nr:unnamed protein product [Spodoptera littoralis]CAH1642634.1 unnamed protein product [Spodoptera littoralis]